MKLLPVFIFAIYVFQNICRIIPFLCGSSTYAVGAYASAYCHRLSDSVCLSLVRVPESRETRGSGFLGGGEAYSGERCKEGCSLQKPRAFWLAA